MTYKINNFLVFIFLFFATTISFSEKRDKTTEDLNNDDYLSFIEKSTKGNNNDQMSAIYKTVAEKGKKDSVFRTSLIRKISDKKADYRFRTELLKVTSIMGFRESKSPQEIKNWQNSLQTIAQDTRDSAIIRAFAIKALRKFRNKENLSILKEALKDKSHIVVSAAGKTLEDYLRVEKNNSVRAEFLEPLENAIYANREHQKETRSLYFALSEIKSQKAKTFLVSLLKDKSFDESRPSIILSLKKYKDKDVYIEVLKFINSFTKKDDALKQIDSEDMFKCIAKDSIRSFYKTLDASAKEDRLAVLKGVRLLGQRNNKKEIQYKVLKYMEDKDPEVRLACLETLPFLFEFAELKSALANTLTFESDVNVRKRAYQILGISPE